MDVLIGADPELFVEGYYEKSPGMKKKGIIPAHKLAVPGTKKAPYKVNNGAVQVDGTAVEINIDPADNDDQFVHNITDVLSQLKTMLPSDVKFSNNITSYFDDIASYPKINRELGCEPDFNAYTEKQNPPLNETLLGSMRFVGGHVHIGWTNDVPVDNYEHFLSCVAITRQMDWMLLLPSMLFDHDTQRNSYYGQPGTFRPKPYGVEYRSLSSAWLNDEKYMRMIFNQAKRGVDLYVDEDKDLHKIYKNVGVKSILNDINAYRVNNYPKHDIRKRIITYIKTYPEVSAGLKDFLAA